MLGFNFQKQLSFPDLFPGLVFARTVFQAVPHPHNTPPLSKPMQQSGIAVRITRVQKSRGSTFAGGGPAPAPARAGAYGGRHVAVAVAPSWVAYTAINQNQNAFPF